MDPYAKRPPTILDIAAVTGLSKSVVSRALNNEPGVSPESRVAVEDAARELGYVRNAMAQRMRSQQVDTIGVLVRDPASPFYGALLGALQSHASERGIRLITMTGSGKPNLEEEREALHSLISIRVDGLMVCSGLLPASDLYPFIERVPTVVVGRSEDDPRISSVCCDDSDGTQQIVDYVVAAGYRTLIVPVPPVASSPSLHNRAKFFIEHARASGIEPEQFAVENAAEVSELLKGRTGTDIAVLAPNDRWAIAIRETVGSSKFLVTGFDGVGVHASPLLGLTTIVQPVDEMAARAIQVLMDILVDDQSPKHVLIPGKLLVPNLENPLTRN